MSRRFYHTIPRRALGGNETPLLECLISHARCLFLEAKDILQARSKILMRQIFVYKRINCSLVEPKSAIFMDHNS